MPFVGRHDPETDGVGSGSRLRQGKSTRLRRAAVATLGVLALGGVWTGITYDIEPDGLWVEGGPLRVPDQNGYVVRYESGEVFTDGFQRLLLEGKAPGVLERVELVGPDADHFEVVGILLAGPDREVGSVQVYDGFDGSATDPAVRGLGRLVPAEGADLATGKTGSVLQIGMRVVKPGLAVRSGIRVYYSVGETRYSAFQPGGVVVCPDGRTDEQCFNALFAEW